MKNDQLQWHPAFFAALSLELAKSRDYLDFEREHNLNVKPLEIDLLIIKKEKDIQIRNEIGYFFRKYNVLEYKAPGDQLDVDSYYKAVAYGCLYKAYGDTVDGRKADDITVSLLRDARPDGLFQYFLEAGANIRAAHQGRHESPFSNTVGCDKRTGGSKPCILKSINEKAAENRCEQVFGIV